MKVVLYVGKFLSNSVVRYRSSPKSAERPFSATVDSRLMSLTKQVFEMQSVYSVDAKVVYTSISRFWCHIDSQAHQ